MSKKVIISLGVVVVLGGGVFVATRGGQEESPYVLTNVVRADLEERVLTTATVKAADEFELSFAAAGRVERVNVEVNDDVEAGAELAALDTAALEARVRQQRAARDSAVAALNQAIAGASDAEIAVAERAVDSAQISLNNALDNLADAERVAEENLDDAYTDLVEVFADVKISAEGAIQTMNAYYNVSCNYQCLRSWGIFLNSPSYESQLESQKVSADAALSSLQATVNASSMATPHTTLDANAQTIKTNANTIVTLLDTAHAAFQEDADRATVQTVRLDLNAKVTILNNQIQATANVKSANTTSTKNAEQAVTNAEAALASARASLDSLLEPPRSVDLAALRANVSSAQANLDSAIADLSNAIIEAPISGTITQVNVKPGEIAGSSAIAIGMVSGATYSVEANVPEADIAKIALGNPVDITLDALPGQNFVGNVIHIDPAEQVIGGVVTFKVTTDIMDGVSMLKPGMTADIDILTASAEGVLAVPQRAIVREDGESYVRIVTGGELERIPVETGIRSADGLIEIKGGLSEDQEIVNFVRE